MASARELLTSLETERFSEIFLASPKKFREEVFRRAGIKAKGGGAFQLSASPKNSVRIQKLVEALGGDDGAGVDEEVLSEVIRNYLYTRREMLALALDHFKIPNDNGLTDEDLTFIEDLKAEDTEALKKLLLDKFSQPDVELYLAFMDFPA